MRSIKRLRTLVEGRRFTSKKLKGPWIAPETGDRDTNLHFIGLGRWDLPFIKTPGLPMHGRLRVPPRRDFFMSPEGKVYTVDVGVLPYAFVADHLKIFGLTLQDPYPFGEPEELVSEAVKKGWIFAEFLIIGKRGSEEPVWELRSMPGSRQARQLRRAARYILTHFRESEDMTVIISGHGWYDDRTPSRRTTLKALAR